MKDLLTRKSEMKQEQDPRWRQEALSTSGGLQDEVNLMLDLESRFHGDRFVAKKIEGCLDRTAKQLRDKRALPSYKALRGEYLPRNSPQEEPSDYPTESSGDEEVAVQEEVVPQPAFPEADGDETQPAPQATEPEIPVVMPTIVVSPSLDPSSPQETRWRQGIADKALALKLPKKAILDESAEAIRLLRGAFQFCL
ncbi:hypothetical protein HHI36_023744 [Cryptolaemus montrouzieri]|uniref:Uncharacterized protein n=1 Tax=Cryptolaemus montrouzieri TaxID=559131 RepID=A0ABD2PHS9_9CUCU